MEKIGPFFDPEPKIYLFQEIASLQLADGSVIYDSTTNLITTDCNELGFGKIKTRKKSAGRIFYTQLGVVTAAFPVAGFGISPGFSLGTAMKTTKSQNRASIWELAFSIRRTRVKNTPIRLYGGGIHRYDFDFSFLYLSLAYLVDLSPFNNKFSIDGCFVRRGSLCSTRA